MKFNAKDRLSLVKIAQSMRLAMQISGLNEKHVKVYAQHFVYNYFDIFYEEPGGRRMGAAVKLSQYYDPLDISNQVEINLRLSNL